MISNLMNMRQWRLLLCLAIMMTSASAALAQGRHPATVVLKNGGQAQGVIRYLPASRNFEISSGPATRQVRADEVAEIILAQPPAQLEGALQAVQRRDYARAIPVLAQIVQDYTMLGPDEMAAQGLMLSYLRTGKSKEALEVGESMVKLKPELTTKGGFASVYWEALLEQKRLSTLRTSLADAIEKGSRDLAAVALLRRGDMEMQDGRIKEALVDGYLRVILMFKDVGFVQPEALYKAIKAHEALNEVANAERWRKRLLTGYAGSEFAEKLK